MNHFYGKLIKLDNKLKYKTSNYEVLYSKFKDQIKEGEIVDVYMESSTKNGTLAQIRKVHLLFRILSEHSGYTIEEIKLLVKENCGFAYNKTINNKYYVIPTKSIGDMTKEELCSLIECTIRFAEENYKLILE